MAVDLSEVFSFFAYDIVCQAVVGRFPREEGRNKLFREMLETNAKLLGEFNLDDYFPSLARLNLVSAKAVKHKERWDDLKEDFIDVLLSVQHSSWNVTRHLLFYIAAELD
jgi:hypothetical protein